MDHLVRNEPNSELLPYIQRARASNTSRAYAADWRHFIAWSNNAGRVSLPASPETIALYLAALASTARCSTLTRRISAISQAHRLAGFSPPPTADPGVRLVMAGIRRTVGTAAQAKRPLTLAELRLLLDASSGGLLGLRDRALLLLGFAGAFRRSELVMLDIGDLEAVPEGLVVTLRKSKTDPERQGRRIGIPRGTNPGTCPVSAVRQWIEALGGTTGPLFRPVDRHNRIASSRLSDKAVALIVKRLAERAGLEPAAYSGHSLRAGLATAAAAAGAPERAILNQTGHRSLTMLRRYIREGSLFRENAATLAGL